MFRRICLLLSMIIFAMAFSGGRSGSQEPAKADSADPRVSARDTLSADEPTRDFLDIEEDNRVTDEYIEIASDSSWWYRKLENKAFEVGERLEFSVKYGKLPAGSAVMEIPQIVDVDGYNCYEVSSVAESNDLVSVFYRVRDTVKTFIDVDGIFPRKFYKKLHEGGYSTEKTTIFDQKNHYAITDNDTIPTYTFVQDAFSSLYYARTQELIPGQDIYIDNHTSKKNFPLTLRVLRKEKVKVSAGKFNCVVVEPVMRAEGIFKAKGRIWVWLTDDQYKMPVMMKTEVFFLGSVSAQLSKYSRGPAEGELE